MQATLSALRSSESELKDQLEDLTQRGEELSQTIAEKEAAIVSLTQTGDEVLRQMKGQIDELTG